MPRAAGAQFPPRKDVINLEGPASVASHLSIPPLTAGSLDKLGMNDLWLNRGHEKTGGAREGTASGHDLH